MSAMAVRRIQSGMACSESGKINRFNVMASLSVRARFDNPARAKDCIHVQLPPDLMPNVHGPGFPMLLGIDALGIDEHQRTCRLTNRGRCTPLAAAFAGPSQRQCRWRLRRRQKLLPLQGRLQLVSERQPLLRGSGFEIAERTDRALSWTFGSNYRFNEQVVGVAFAFVDPFGLCGYTLATTILMVVLSVNEILNNSENN